MREVRACDFCGERASGVYEPLSPTVGDGPRMLLCDGCGETLSGVLQPLLDRLEGDGGVEATARTPDPAPAAEPTQPATEPDPEAASDPDPSTPASGPSSEIGGRPAKRRSGTPRGYRKVMRFLEGREFPIDRDEAETMAAEAYDLESETVSAIVDHAKKHGRLREVRGQLKR